MKNFIDFNGRKIYYHASGNGPAIVLLHGFLESGEIWKSFARRLGDTYMVVAIDLPGHGRSDPGGAVQSMDEMADAVRKVLKTLDVKSCLLAGHSMGGYVALAFAEKYPRLLRGFILFHSHAAADTPETRINRDRTTALVQSDHHGFIKYFIPELFDRENVKKYIREIEELKRIAENTSREGILASIEGMKNRPDRQHVLLNSKVPVLFIIGKNDSKIPLEVIVPQTLLPEHSEVLYLDHVGHMGFIEASGRTCAALKGFAERCF